MDNRGTDFSKPFIASQKSPPRDEMSSHKTDKTNKTKRKTSPIHLIGIRSPFIRYIGFDDYSRMAAPRNLHHHLGVMHFS
jgi:hypothetical protein